MDFHRFAYPLNDHLLHAKSPNHHLHDVQETILVLECHNYALEYSMIFIAESIMQYLFIIKFINEKLRKVKSDDYLKALNQELRVLNSLVH